MLRRGAGEHGSATAETAVVLPVVVLVLALCLGALQLGARQLRLQDAAADAARAVARGEPASSAAGRAAGAVSGASLAVEHDADLVCAVLRAPASTRWIDLGEQSARSCALGGGR